MNTKISTIKSRYAKDGVSKRGVCLSLKKMLHHLGMLFDMDQQYSSSINQADIFEEDKDHAVSIQVQVG